MKKTNFLPLILLFLMPSVNGESLDWRDYQGGNWVTAIKDQARFGHCWAFASIALVESQVKIFANNPDLAVDLSEQMLQSCVFDRSFLWFMDPIFDFLRDTGTVDEACFPFDDLPDPPACTDRCDDWHSRITRISEWKWLFPPYQPPPHVVDMMKTALESGPIGARITVYRDFASDYTEGVYIHTGGEEMGDHFIVLIGYNDTSADPDQKYWIGKNSWGENWGEQGFCRIRMGTNEAGIEEQVAQVLIHSVSPEECETAGVTLEISTEYVNPGDSFSVVARVCNTGEMWQNAFFTAVLDLGTGSYWFFPSWTLYPPDMDFLEMTFLPGETSIDVIPEMIWPDTGTASQTGIRLYGAVLDQDLSTCLGTIGYRDFGYGPGINR
ncbi:hypothetical protein JXA80_05875 [bacterium]|nr:hypothetical protein [candidate division CSSED10-310 bacterium]